MRARGYPALPAWGAQDGKTVDNPGENGIIVGKDTEGAGDVGKKTVVIGETMKRVMGYAAKINAEVYDGFNYYAKTKAIFGEKLADFIGGVDTRYGLSIKW